MRLIDADELKDWITGHCDIELDEATEGEILRVIDDQFTAFDVDKVVEQLECEYISARCSNNKPCNYPESIGCCYDRAISKAVEIVKGGGLA